MRTGIPVDERHLLGLMTQHAMCYLARGAGPQWAQIKG